MRSAVDSILQSIREFFKKLSRKEIIRIIILAVVIIGLGITVAAILSKTRYETLYTGLSSEAAGQVLTTLQEWGEDAKAEGSGTILVPEGKAAELNMRLSNEKLPSGGFDYSIYLNAAGGFGSTDDDKHMYATMMLEQNLRTQLNKMSKIEDSYVKLSIPSSTPFVLSKQTEESSAAVTLELTSDEKLSQSEVDAVAATVLKAVQGLKYENISIVDNNMNRYRVGDTENSEEEITILDQVAMATRIEDELVTRVVELLEAVFGSGSVRAMASATLDFDDVVSEEIVFEPPVNGETEGIAIALSESYERSRLESAAEGVPGTDSNGMGSFPEYPYGDLGEGELYDKYVREINYELNKLTKQIKQAKGKLTELSIAVMVNSESVTEDYTPNILNLVTNAVGVDESHISVEALPFTENTAAAEALAAQEELLKDMATRELIRTIIIAVMVVLLVVAVLLFVRSMLRSGREQDAMALAVAGGPGGAIDYMAMDEIYANNAVTEIDLNSKSESLESLERFIERDPEAVAQLLRNWLMDD